MKRHHSPSMFQYFFTINKRSQILKLYKRVFNAHELVCFNAGLKFKALRWRILRAFWSTTCLMFLKALRIFTIHYETAYRFYSDESLINTHKPDASISQVYINHPKQSLRADVSSGTKSLCIKLQLCRTTSRNHKCISKSKTSGEAGVFLAGCWWRCTWKFFANWH